MNHHKFRVGYKLKFVITYTLNLVNIICNFSIPNIKLYG